jgi:hypothetical protein
VEIRIGKKPRGFSSKMSFESAVFPAGWELESALGEMQRAEKQCFVAQTLQ